MGRDAGQADRATRTTRADLTTALDRVLDRVPRVGEQAGERFPLFADPGTGQWTTSRRGSWTGGFWAGLWWLRAAVRGGAEHDIARRWTERLVPGAADDTATRGMTFWYGAGSGHRLTGDPRAAEVADVGRAALASAFDTGHRVVPFGSAFDSPDRPPTGPRAVIDPLAGIVALLAGGPSPREELRSLARAHTARHVELCLGADGAVCPEAPLRAGPAEPALPARRAASGWARGQAWGMLGFAVAARELGSEFTEPARRSAAWWRERVRPGEVPHAALADPASPVDTSAAAIAAAALLTLAELGGPEADEHRATARGAVEHLVARHLRADGVLGAGCYDHHRGLACAHELVWGTYFLAATLAALSGRVSRSPW